MSTLYPYSWAENVYNRFVKKYARATDIFRIISNHSGEYPINLLRSNQEKWERYKKIIKNIDKQDRFMFPDTEEPLGEHLLSYFEDYLYKTGQYPSNSAK